MQKILVALDGSPRSAIVLDAAVKIAHRTAGQLVLFRAFGIPPEMPAHVWKEQGTLADVLEAEARKDLEERRKTLPPDLKAEVRVGIGVPWQAVCTAAKSMKADLIVIGSHGYTPVDRVLGTTAAKIVNHADCSVLVVRHAADVP